MGKINAIKQEYIEELHKLNEKYNCTIVPETKEINVVVKSNDDNEKNLKIYQKKYNELCNKFGLEIDMNRVQINLLVTEKH